MQVAWRRFCCARVSPCNEIVCLGRGLVAEQNHPSLQSENRKSCKQWRIPFRPNYSSSGNRRRVCMLDSHLLSSTSGGHTFDHVPYTLHPPSTPTPFCHPRQKNRAKIQTPQGPARSSRRAALPYAPRIPAQQAFSGTFVAKPREGSGAHMAKVVTSGWQFRRRVGKL